MWETQVPRLVTIPTTAAAILHFVVVEKGSSIAIYRIILHCEAWPVFTNNLSPPPIPYLWSYHWCGCHASCYHHPHKYLHSRGLNKLTHAKNNAWWKGRIFLCSLVQLYTTVYKHEPSVRIFLLYGGHIKKYWCFSPKTWLKNCCTKSFSLFVVQKLLS